MRADPFIVAQVPNTAVCGGKLPVNEMEAIACSLQGQENLLISQCLLAVVLGSVSATGATCDLFGVSFSRQFAAARKHFHETLTFPKYSSNEHG